jgi:hypothetical protein
MKSLFLRSGVALACALALASCGGGKGNLYVSGTVAGLVADGLVLTNNGGPDLVVAANATSFVFPDLLGNDAGYNVVVKSSPASAVCAPYNNTNKGTTSTFDITTVVILCVTNTYDLGGTVTGLTTDGLVLINGSDRVTVPAARADAIPAGNTTFKLSKVGDGSNYGVTVLTQPAGKSCTVTNGTGKMGAAAVTNIQVSCVDRT